MRLWKVSSLIQVMACRLGDKPLPESVMANFERDHRVHSSINFKINFQNKNKNATVKKHFTSNFCEIWVWMSETPDSKVHVANMGSTWVLSAPGGPHVGPMNLAIRDPLQSPHSLDLSKDISYLLSTHTTIKLINFTSTKWQQNLASWQLSFFYDATNNNKVGIMTTLGFQWSPVIQYGSRTNGDLIVDGDLIWGCFLVWSPI